MSFMIFCLLQNLKEPVITTTREAAEVVDQVLPVDDYEILFNKPEEFVVKYQGNDQEDTLDIMNSFTSITLLASKVGEMVFPVHLC